MILCLDGLDEVEAQHRNACVQALNQFIQAHGRTEMVVCSRVRDYEALSGRLKLRSAIYVQPLTPKQIDQYLNQAGEQLMALKTVLQNSAEIQAFASSPLILSIMSLAYQGCSLDEFSQLGTAATWRQSLFDAYIERMFQRRGTTQQYSPEQAKRWLIWMAQRMAQASQTVFLIERLQPSWLQTWTQRIQYRLESILVYGLIVGLIFGLISGLSVGLRKGLISGLISGLRKGLIFGVFFGLIGVFLGSLGDIKTVETLKWSWKEAFNSFCSGLNGGPIFGLIIGLIGVLSSWLSGGLNGVLSDFGLNDVLSDFGLSDFGLSDFGLIFGLISVLIFGLISWLIGGAVAGLIVGLIVGLIGGLRGPEIQKRSKPNQGIWKSARNALVITLIFGLIAGLIVGLSEDNLISMLSTGLEFGLIAGLIVGGSACIRHFALRIMLYGIGYIPWNYARFLDYAAERLFLQKVGGGYIFIHRMLLEHFARMELDRTQS